MKKILFLPILMSIVFSLEAKEIEVNSFSIQLPEFIKPDYSLNQKAVLQYSNPEKEFYIILMEYPKRELTNINLSKAYTLLTDEVAGSIQESKITKAKDLKINDLNRKRGIITGKLDNNGTLYSLYYKMDVIEGKEKYYEILIWILEKDKTIQEKNIDSILNSFKEK